MEIILLMLTIVRKRVVESLHLTFLVSNVAKFFMAKAIICNFFI